MINIELEMKHIQEEELTIKRNQKDINMHFVKIINNKSNKMNIKINKMK